MGQDIQCHGPTNIAPTLALPSPPPYGPVVDPSSTRREVSGRQDSADQPGTALQSREPGAGEPADCHPEYTVLLFLRKPHCIVVCFLLMANTFFLYVVMQG